MRHLDLISHQKMSLLRKYHLAQLKDSVFCIFVFGSLSHLKLACYPSSGHKAVLPDGLGYRRARQERVTLTRWQARFLLGVVSQEGEHRFISPQTHVAALPTHLFFLFWISPSPWGGCFSFQIIFQRGLTNLGGVFVEWNFTCCRMVPLTIPSPGHQSDHLSSFLQSCSSLSLIVLTLHVLSLGGQLPGGEVTASVVFTWNSIWDVEEFRKYSLREGSTIPVGLVWAARSQWWWPWLTVWWNSSAHVVCHNLRVNWGSLRSWGPLWIKAGPQRIHI